MPLLCHTSKHRQKQPPTVNDTSQHHSSKEPQAAGGAGTATTITEKCWLIAQHGSSRPFPHRNITGIVFAAVQRGPPCRDKITIESRLPQSPVDGIMCAAHPSRELLAAAYSRRVAPEGSSTIRQQGRQRGVATSPAKPATFPPPQWQPWAAGFKSQPDAGRVISFGSLDSRQLQHSVCECTRKLLDPKAAITSAVLCCAVPARPHLTRSWKC